MSWTVATVLYVLSRASSVRFHLPFCLRRTEPDHLGCLKNKNRRFNIIAQLTDLNTYHNPVTFLQYHDS